MKKEDMSCIDCAVKNCNKMDKTYPDFCLTTHMDEEALNEAMECYNEDENRKVTIAAAEVEYNLVVASFKRIFYRFSFFLLYRKLLSCKVKNAPRGCALRRIR